METIIAENPTLAFLAILIPAILAAAPSIYNVWRQRNKTDAEKVKTEADAAKVIGEAYVQLQNQYKEMIDILKLSYDECANKMDILSKENEELERKIECLENEKDELQRHMRILEKKVAELENGGSHAVRS
jgi:uncharacterized protein YhaN